MNFLEKIFLNRDIEIYKVKKRLLNIRKHQTMMSKRLSYLQDRNPQVFARLHDKKDPIARITDEERQAISDEIDKLLENLK